MSKAVAKKAPAKKAAKPAPAPKKKASVEKATFLKVYDSVRVKLKQLLPDAGNPREMPASEFESLIASLSEFGLVEPFVARAEDKRIVGGHQRALGIAEFLRRKGVAEEQIPDQEVTVVFVPGLTESKCRALNLALNRVHGKFDYTKMPDFLGGIDAGDILLTGFLDDEIKDILHLGSMPPPDEGDPDEYLANMQLKFDFKVATADEAAAVREVLGSYGMTGPKDASAAFVMALKAAAKKKRPVAAE